MIIDSLAHRILEETRGLGEDVVDYGVGLHYVYVLLDIGGERYLGIAHSAVEEYPEGYWVSGLDRSMVMDMVSSTNIMDKNIAVAYLNALSQYLIRRNKIRLRYGVNAVDAARIRSDDVVVVVGNIKPTVKRALRYTDKVYVLERTPSMRDGALPDTAAPRVIPRADVLLITGMTLINDTLDYIISLATGARERVLVGGTAQVYPPFIKEHGITLVGSIETVDIEGAVLCIRRGCDTKHLSRYTKKYVA